jgi:NAD(P)-dependent dehydrogenase (short-subunit alcohol dehydrogenase family)
VNGKLTGRVAIVTGAARGIGRAIARKLCEEGATVVIADIDAAGGQAAAAELPSAAAVTTDISNPEQVSTLVDTTVRQYGRIDILVNNAAIVPFTPWDEIDLAEWRRIMAVNLDGVFLMSRFVSDQMRQSGYGRIVNIAINVNDAGTPNLAHYVAAKGGVWGLTRTLAGELGKYGITVNAVAPGLTESEATLTGEHARAFAHMVPMQAIPRPGVGDDIAPVVSFLASEESRWVTGQMIVADGGPRNLSGSST